MHVIVSGARAAEEHSAQQTVRDKLQGETVQTVRRICNILVLLKTDLQKSTF